jgi:hypothetical protein
MMDGNWKIDLRNIVSALPGLVKNGVWLEGINDDE